MVPSAEVPIASNPITYIICSTINAVAATVERAKIRILGLKFINNFLNF